MTDPADADRAAALEAEVITLRRQLQEAHQDTDRTLIRTTRLAQIVTALGQVDPSGRLERVACEVAELYSADVALLLLGDDQQLRVAARWGVPAADLPDEPHRVSTDIAALTSAHPVVACPAGDVPTLPGLEGYGLAHVAWIRLLVRDSSAGFLLLGRRADMAFSPSDAPELRAVGSRVALIIENTKLQRRTTQQLEQMRLLHQVSAALAGTVEFSKAGQALADAVLTAAPSATAALYRPGADDEWICCARQGDASLPDRLTSGALAGRDALALRDGDAPVGYLVVEGVPAFGAARALLPHLQDLGGLVLGKVLLHEQTVHQATIDALTGLPNRTRLRERIDAALGAGESVAVLFLDLDGFKAVNDRFGHEVGDDLLKVIARRLQSAVRPSDCVARLGGDEFVVLCQHAPSSDQAMDVAQRIAAVMAAPVVVAGEQIRVSASQGIALSRPQSTPDSLLRESDAAMYVAKAKGKDRIERYDAGTIDRLARHTARC